MFKRLGAVIWWVGAIFAAVGLYTVGASQIELSNCPGIMSLRDKIDAANVSAVSLYRKENGKTDQIAEALSITRDPRETDDFLNSEKLCKKQENGLVPLMTCAIFALFLWSIAFVLGGSFWRPPKYTKPLSR